MGLIHSLSVRLNKAEFRHIEQLGKKHGSITQAMRFLILRDMAARKQLKPEQAIENFPIRTFYLLRELILDFYEQKSSALNTLRRADEAALEVMDCD
jgi:hypothetical protein